jgi:hypothetical protein
LNKKSTIIKLGLSVILLNGIAIINSTYHILTSSKKVSSLISKGSALSILLYLLMLVIYYFISGNKNKFGGKNK